MSSIEWPTILNRFGETNLKWKIGSKVIVPTIGLISKLWTQCLNSTKIHNHFVLTETLTKHYKNGSKRPLITISNHSSCLDDPLIWGPLIPLKWQLNASRHRWSVAAQEICFTNGLYSLFFSLGKTFPIVRGRGIYQPAMDYALDLLRNGQWLHFFPEGKVVDTKNDPKVSDDIEVEVKTNYEFKWGLAQLILEHVFSDKTCGEIEVLPFYHIGMNDILPTRKPYIPLINKRTTFLIREDGPLLFDKKFLSALIEDISNVRPKDKRIKIMKFFENEMKCLKTKAIKLHNCFDENIVSVKTKNF